MVGKALSFFSNDIGIDLGTANTLIYVRDKGIVLREPSVVAVDIDNNEVIAVGNDAKKVLGRTPQNIRAMRPLKDGVIADFEITEQMLRQFIRKVHRPLGFAGPSMLVSLRMVVAVPTGITSVEKRAVEESAIRAGASEVRTLPEPVAAAIGVGLPIDEPAANMIVDIGGGTTEVAIISYHGVVYTDSIRIAGDEMDEAVTKYMKDSYQLIIGERTAEEIKIRIGSASILSDELEMSVSGRDSMSGLPKTLHISSQEIREALKPTVTEISTLVHRALEHCPPELAADLVNRGFVLAGGGALLRNLDVLLTQHTGLPVITAEDPLCAVVNGAGRYIQNLNYFLRSRR